MKNKAFTVAYRVLKKVYESGAYSQIELNKQLYLLKNEQDKPLITKLVYGVLENNLQLEYYLNQFVKKAPKPNITIILKMGAFCALYLEIPSYAYVNELVELSKQTAKKAEVGFVNKVLKLVSQTPLTLPQNADELTRLSIEHSYPVWLLKKLKKQYGLAVLNNLLQTKKSSFKHIRVNLTQISVSEFVQKLNSHQINYQTSPLKNALFVDYASVLKHPEWASLYTVQSLGSMLIVDAMNIKDKTKVLDVCAAPGGKTCYIAEKNPNGTVLAFDLYEHRVELIKKYANRLNLTNITAKKSDATQLDESLQEQFDAVLCDAPCSGIGMVQKKPDILLFRTEKSITTLQKLQLSILKTASHYVKQGGTLLYSTCTLLKEENIQVIRAFLQQNQQFCLKPVQIEGLDSIKEDNTVTLLPNNEGQEGYFIARLEKNEKNIIR